MYIFSKRQVLSIFCHPHPSMFCEWGCGWFSGMEGKSVVSRLHSCCLPQGTVQIITGLKLKLWEKWYPIFIIIHLGELNLLLKFKISKFIYVCLTLILQIFIFSLLHWHYREERQHFILLQPHLLYETYWDFLVWKLL